MGGHTACLYPLVASPDIEIDIYTLINGTPVLVTIADFKDRDLIAQGRGFPVICQSSRYVSRIPRYRGLKLTGRTRGAEMR